MDNIIFHIVRQSFRVASIFFCLVTLSPLASSQDVVLQSSLLENGVIKLKVGEEGNVGLYEDAKPIEGVRYESGNPGFFTVDAAGVIKGVHEGTSLLSAGAGGKSASAVVVVWSPGGAVTPSGRSSPVNGIVAANAGGKIPVGAVERIIAHVLPYQVVGTNPFRVTSSNPKILAADDKVKTVEALSPGRAEVTVSTLDGSLSTTVGYEVVSVPATASVETYELEAERFGIVYGASDEASAKANSAGLQTALNHAASNGFGRVLLGREETLFIEPRDTVRMVSGVQLDLNGSEIRLRPNDYPRYVAFLFGEKPDAGRVLENASIVNGTITGERNEKESEFPNWAGTPATEGGCSIVFEEGRNNGISNLVVRKSIGFNISSGTGMRAHGSKRFTDRTLAAGGMEDGAFDAAGKPVDAEARIRTAKPVDMAGLGTDFYVVGYPLGYQGYPFVNSRIYDVCFYDADMKFLGIERGRYRYRRYDMPAGAAFANFSFYHKGVPASGNGDFGGAFAFVHNPQEPLGNYIIDCVIEDNYSCGFAACGGQRWTIRGNVFRRNGGRMPGCDIDWEDGWEYMQGDLIEDNSFESRVNVITCAGTGFVFRNNTFRGESVFYGRTQHYSFLDNIVDSEDTGKPAKISFSAQTDFYTSGNVYRDARLSLGREHSRMAGAEYGGKMIGDKFERTDLSGAAGIASLTDCVFEAGTNSVSATASSFAKCKFSPGAYRMAGTVVNSEASDVSFIVEKGTVLEINNSSMRNPSFSAGGQCVGVSIDQCEISIDKPLTLVTPTNMGAVRVANSAIKLTAEASPFIFCGGWNAAGANARIDLQSVKFLPAEGVGGYLHKFSWYPAADSTAALVYNLVGTVLPESFKLTDDKGEASNAVFNKKQ